MTHTPQSQNCKVLAGIIDRHTFCVAYGIVDKRKGLITREKNTTLGLKRSVIDFVIISRDLIEHMEHIHIDDERLHVLTMNRERKTGIDFGQGDHNLIITKFNLKWSSNKVNVTEVFKYNDKYAKYKFKQVTTDTKSSHK